MRLARYLARSFTVTFALLLASPSFGGEPLAIVTDLQGSAIKKGSGRLAILAQLGAGAELELEAGARMTVAHFAGGRQFDLDGPGSFRLTPVGVESAGGGRVTPHAPLASVYRHVHLRPARIAQTSISMRGGPDDMPLQLMSPVGTWILENRPVFRWQPTAGVASYHFQLTDNTGGVLYETSSGEPSVGLPDSITLGAGQTYAWQVDAIRPNSPVVSGWTEFGIADVDRRERVEAARPGPGASFGDRVLFALLLDDSGFREIASAVWDELARERSADSRMRTLGASR